MTILRRNGKAQLRIHIQGKEKARHTDCTEADWRRREAQKAIEDRRIQQECVKEDLW